MTWIPVFRPVSQLLSHEALQADVQDVFPLPSPQLAGAEMAQVLYKSLFAWCTFKKVFLGHPLKDMRSRGRTMIHQGLQACCNAMEEAIAVSTNFQAAQFGARENVEAEEFLESRCCLAALR